MLGLIIGLLALVFIIVAVLCCIDKTPDNLRGFYGGMFWSIATVAIVAVGGLVVLCLL